MNLNIGIDGKGYAIGGSADFSRIDSTFSGRTSTGNQPLTISGTGGACGSGCSASVEGFLAGANAERAGLGYLVEDLGTLKDIVGTAAFKKN
jgi:hypothetical protein